MYTFIISVAPPPTYAQCVKGEVNIADDTDTEYTRGRLIYAPCYPFYNIGTESTSNQRHQSGYTNEAVTASTSTDMTHSSKTRHLVAQPNSISGVDTSAVDLCEIRRTSEV